MAESMSWEKDSIEAANAALAAARQLMQLSEDSNNTCSNSDNSVDGPRQATEIGEILDRPRRAHKHRSLYDIYAAAEQVVLRQNVHYRRRRTIPEPERPKGGQGGGGGGGNGVEDVDARPRTRPRYRSLRDIYESTEPVAAAPFRSSCLPKATEPPPEALKI